MKKIFSAALSLESSVEEMSHDNIASVVNAVDASYQEVSEHNDTLENSFASMEAMTNLQAVVSAIGKRKSVISSETMMVLTTSLENIEVDLGIKDSVTQDINEETFPDTDAVATENSIGEKIKNVFVAIVEFLKKLFNKIVGFIARLFSSYGAMKKYVTRLALENSKLKDGAPVKKLKSSQHTRWFGKKETTGVYDSFDVINKYVAFPNASGYVDLTEKLILKGVTVSDVETFTSEIAEIFKNSNLPTSTERTNRADSIYAYGPLPGNTYIMVEISKLKLPKFEIRTDETSNNVKHEDVEALSKKECDKVLKACATACDDGVKLKVASERLSGFLKKFIIYLGKESGKQLDNESYDPTKKTILEVVRTFGSYVNLACAVLPKNHFSTVRHAAEVCRQSMKALNGEVTSYKDEGGKTISGLTIDGEFKEVF